jgi:hypothetical protein
MPDVKVVKNEMAETVECEETPTPPAISPRLPVTPPLDEVNVKLTVVDERDLDNHKSVNFDADAFTARNGMLSPCVWGAAMAARTRRAGGGRGAAHRTEDLFAGAPFREWVGKQERQKYIDFDILPVKDQHFIYQEFVKTEQSSSGKPSPASSMSDSMKSMRAHGSGATGFKFGN